MTTERDPGTRIVLSWLREDAHENAERVLLRALDEVDATPQRRSSWPARRSMAMTRFLLAAGVAAAVLALAAFGLKLLPVPDFGVEPRATPTIAPGPTQVTSATDAPRLPAGPLAPGTYTTEPFSGRYTNVKVTLQVPGAWHGYPPGAVTPEAGPGAPDGGAVAFLMVAQLYSDPCNIHESSLVSAGTTVGNLIEALREVASSYVVGADVDVTIDGYAGKRLDILLPSDDFAGCDEGQYWVFDTPPFAQGPDNRWHLWILDVDGTRVVILGHDFPRTPASVQKELRDIVASIRIEP